MKNLTFLFLFFVGIGAVSAQDKIDLTGTWLLAVETDAGSGTPTFTLKQDAEGNLTGTYQGQLGETELKGTVKGTGFHIEFSVQDNPVKYDGKIENETMSGKVAIGTLATGTFTGKRKADGEK